MAATQLIERPARTAPSGPPPRRPDEHRHLASQLVEHAAMDRDDPRRRTLRDRLVVGYLPVARRIARRFDHRGEPLDDLMQVATIGLIHAVDRYRPEFGHDFLSYAIPTIRGEIRRHFRDKGWAMRVPRRLRDLHVSINAAVAELSQTLGHPPRPSEISEHLGTSLEEILEGLEAAHAYRGESLDEQLGHPDNAGDTLAELLGGADPQLEHVEYHQALRSLLADLPERERGILMMRFFGNMTQSEIGRRVGLSQMHVSRLLAQTLAILRERLRN